MTIDKKINEYQWNDQIIKRNTHKSKQSGSGSGSVLWQQVIVRYHGNKVSSSIKSSHAYQRVRQRSDITHQA